MPSELECALFEQEFGEIADLPESARWHVERDAAVPLGIIVTIHSIKKPLETYIARLRWPMLFEPPSLKFLTLDGRLDNNPGAWPKCRGFRPSQLDACTSWTLEGHSLHPEWRLSPKTAFQAPERPVRFALLTLQSELDMFYEGRGS